MKGTRNSLHAMIGEIVPKGQVRRRIFQHLLVAFLTLPRRVNFTQLAGLGFHHDSTYHDWFSRDLGIKTFNMDLIQRHGSGDYFVIFDPSFLPKSGKKTPHLGWFWSGSAKSAKRGLEIGGFAVCDLGHHTAFHLNASLTPAPPELKKENRTLVEHYVLEVGKNREAIAQFGNKLAVDGYFGIQTFVAPVVAMGIELVSRLRANAVVFYPPNLPAKRGPGRPPKKGGRIDWQNIDEDRLPIVFLDDEKRVRSGLAYVKSLKRMVLLLVVEFLRPDGSVAARKHLFSTNLLADPLQTLQTYGGRFQIEFLFRDAKQFTGLSHCQSRDKNKLENHINLSLTAVSVANIAHHLNDQLETKQPFSMNQIKEYYHIEYLLDRFSVALGLNPIETKNNPRIKSLLFSMNPEAIAA